ncbi:D-tyrosyl-tRNA(Tyr) deacylase [Sedimentibacter sp. zth1]|uniref:D-aminoacyl-tRNA deacylase n=1 Tax=Sedimentibacter sp. zth1 TaxID=2816908 RepID=UPI001A926D05|nr:D-aminoacyl-tRNA deacylase [Sedimentibacter sp. zth1]QSX06334.1 D-tyrosyl-tRNA(Tyr) deacylase [Sedimentibacter sp. zth1]
MRAVIQRVKHASVTIDDEMVGKIDKGILVFLGISEDDNESDLDYVFNKTVVLRIFEDENGKMNKSLSDINGSILVVSQFTLQGDARKGRRPSYSNAARPEKALPLYEEFITKCRNANINTQTGKFGADMKVELLNDGPVTILLDSTKLF